MLGTQLEEYVRDEKDEKKRLFNNVIEYLKKGNPNPTTELRYKNPYELLVAVILSAQTHDKRVNIVTQSLFQKYPTVEDMANATADDIYQYISSVSYAGNKSSYLERTAKILVDKYRGVVPDDVNELQTLPGVGRKTANVVAATLFNKPVIAVDTHVIRVANRIGLVDTEKPIEIEDELTINTPKELRSKISHWLILHGRYICTSRNPRCNKCGIKGYCRYYLKS